MRERRLPTAQPDKHGAMYRRAGPTPKTGLRAMQLQRVVAALVVVSVGLSSMLLVSHLKSVESLDDDNSVNVRSEVMTAVPMLEFRTHSFVTLWCGAPCAGSLGD